MKSGIIALLVLILIATLANLLASLGVIGGGGGAGSEGGEWEYMVKTTQDLDKMMIEVIQEEEGIEPDGRR